MRGLVLPIDMNLGNISYLYIRQKFPRNEAHDSPTFGPRRVCSGAFHRVNMRVHMLTYRVYALTSVISYSIGDSGVCESAWLERAHRAKSRKSGERVWEVRRWDSDDLSGQLPSTMGM